MKITKTLLPVVGFRPYTITLEVTSQEQHDALVAISSFDVTIPDLVADGKRELRPAARDIIQSLQKTVFKP